MKTLAVKIVEQQRIAYELREYVVDEEDLAATTVAAKVGLPAEQVFKTLVLRGSSQSVLLAAVPATTAIDLKALARIAQEKWVEMVQMKELLPLTGYIRGGVSPIGTKKKYPFYLDASAQNYAQISLSAGKRGLQILLAPSDLVRLTTAIIAPISNSTQ